MKKTIMLILCTLLVAVMFVGCGTPAATTEAPATAAEASDSQPAEETAAGEPAEESPAAAEETPEEGISGADADMLASWDLETEPDRIHYTEIEATYGPLPDVPEGLAFGAVMCEPSNEYWKSMGDGIMARCTELGIQSDVQFPVSTFDSSTQLQLAENLVQKELDAYILSPLTDDLFINLTNTLNARGVPVMNPLLDYPNADVYIGAIDSEVSTMAAQDTIDELGGEGKIAICLGQVGSKINTMRCGAYADYIRENSNIEIVAEMPAEWIPDKAMQMTQDLMTTNPDIELIWCANDALATGVIEGLRAKGALDKVKVWALDGTTVGMQAIKAGEMEATYETDPYFLGQLAVDCAIRKIAGQDVARVVTGPMVQVNIDNVDEYLAKKLAR